MESTKPINHNKKWTDDEYNKMIIAIKDNKMSLDDASKLFGRSNEAILYKLRKYIYTEITNGKTFDILISDLNMDKDTITNYYNDYKKIKDIELTKNKLKITKQQIKEKINKQNINKLNENDKIHLKRLDLLTRKLEYVKKIKEIRYDKCNDEMKMAYDKLIIKIEKQLDNEILNQLVTK